MIARFSILFVLIPFISISQTAYKPGYVVKMSGDTMTGYIKEDVETKLKNGIYFSNSASGDSKQFYTSGEISSFAFDAGNFFQKISYKRTPEDTSHTHFAKFLLSGFYKLYSFYENDQLFFVVMKKDDSQKDTAYFIYGQGDKTSYGDREIGNYENQLLFLALNCEKIKSNILKVTYNERGITSYIKSLNECLAPGEASTVLYKKAKSNIRVYAFAGGLPKNNGQYEAAGRIISRFTLPSISKNVSFNIGVSYLKRILKDQATIYGGYQKDETIENNILSIPATVQYNLTTGIIQPYVDAGLSLAFIREGGEVSDNGKVDKMHNRIGPALVAAVGVESFVTNKLVIKAEWRHELFLHSPIIGVAYFFK